MSARAYHRLVLIALCLTLIVIVLGAWVRLTDAGLGCPDWPGCYGELTWPKTEQSIAEANERWAHRPVETGKAVREMVHRYFAGALGLLILAIAIFAWRRRREPGQPVALPFALLGLIIFQAALGMWTVTLLLKPAIVLSHLIGGLLTFTLLSWLYWRTRPKTVQTTLPQRRLRAPVTIALVVLIMQIMLGGWVSTNYAALACPDFPTCMGQWWPEQNYSEGFTIWRGIGVDYEGGVLDQPSRMAIHVAHRIGALVVIAVFGWLLWLLTRTEGMGRWAGVLGALLVTQISLGLANILAGLPLAVAVAHNGVAALLLATMVSILFHTSRPVERHR
ncbi:COX15/CtaA family protein [Wenzhouxiangella marina]|uniref:Cytochrome oxidase assembly n=1 Tax=Wenzhouxiangella marina TaxID=1579979 RepID=A0A0K0XW88_9GAMM|nr:COX15/CtaA family protein [Wenzhouxiangella marina]AKS41892.1 Cytochrome oxidase assembly [Wenzhouxiangella marina]MBB6086341.1 cytochrome c oxidase assembly protein subunit 15 [Wenzhouxiangella marina]